MTPTPTSSRAEEHHRRWRPRDRRGPVCGYTFRGRVCERRAAHYCEPRADRLVMFFRRMLVHTKGPLKRTAFVLLDWQEHEIIRPLFGEVLWSSEWGCYVRRYRIAYIIVARKNGKSELAAGIQLYMLVGDDEESAEVYCLAPETRVLTAGMSWVRLGDVQVGDELVGFDENVPEGASRRKMRSSAVTSLDRVQLPCMRVTLTDGRTVIASESHRWLAKNSSGSNTVRWLETRSLMPGSRIRDLGPAWEEDQSKGAGYLAGVFDGEASFHRGKRAGYRISFAQRPGTVMDTTRALAIDRGFSISQNRKHSNGVEEFSLSGMAACFRFLGAIRPARLLSSARSWWEGSSMRTGWAEVASVESVGVREVVAVGTSTKTLFAEGLASHNCAAKDTKQAGKVFEPALRMVQLSPGLSRRLRHVKNARRLVDETSGSHYEILTADALGELGHNPHAFNLDEVLSQPDGSLWQTMTTAVGARLQELCYATTTETNDSASFGADLIDEAERIQEDPARAPHVFAFVRKMPRDEQELERLHRLFPGHPDLPVSTDPWDERNWKWPNPGLDEFKSRESLRRQALEAKNDPAKENGFKQFQLNQRVQQVTRYIPMDLWDANAGQIAANPDWVTDDLAGRQCWGGLDLSSKFDLTAWALLFGDGSVLWRFWVPESVVPELDKHTDEKFSQWVSAGWVTATDGNVIDYEAIYDAIEADNNRFLITNVTYDKWTGEPVRQEIESRTGLEMVESNTTFERMTAPMTELTRLLKSHQLRTYGNPVARWCADNLEAKRPRDDPDRIRPVKPDRHKSGKRIDGLPALLFAIDGRMSEAHGADVEADIF